MEEKKPRGKKPKKQSTKPPKPKPLVVLVDIGNTLSALNEGLVHRYEERYPPKKNRSGCTDGLELISTLDFRDVTKLRFCEAKNNYPLKDRPIVENLMVEPGFLKSVDALPNGARALKEMRGMGIEVRIVGPSVPNPTESLEWVDKMFHTPDWLDRVIFTNDKTILKGDYLIDDDPSPIKEESLNQTPEWEHIIFDRPWNRDKCLDKRRIVSWDNWKVDMGLDETQRIKENSTLQSFGHGSEDSRDVDKYYVFSYLPEKKECYSFCNGTGGEDRNILVLEDGVVRFAHKGFPDECNNDFLRTYPLHPQEFSCPIQRKVTRNVVQKVMSTIRKIAAMYNCKNPDAIKALKSHDFNIRREMVANADFLESDQLTTEELKQIATQTGLSRAIMQGKEIFTKREVVESFAPLRPFIYRHDDVRDKKHLAELNVMKSAILANMEAVDTSEHEGDLCMFRLREGYDGEWNHFHYQSRGMIFDIDREDCVMYGWDHEHAKLRLPEPTWPISVRKEGEKEDQPDASIRWGEVVNVFSFRDEIRVCGESSLSCPAGAKEALQRTGCDLTKLDFTRYYHIFQLGTTQEGASSAEETHPNIYLVGLRLTWSNELMSHSAITLYASAHGLPVGTGNP